MTIPHITIEQYSAAFQIKDTEPEHVKSFVLNTYNERIDKANAEQQESEYITAAQARALGAGNAEFQAGDGSWELCQSLSKEEFPYLERFIDTDKVIKYRAINQAQPEPVDPHAALRAEYAKQVAEGTVGFYNWEYYSSNEPVWRNANPPQFFMERQYRCTDISCMVAKQGEPAKRMLRSEAQELFVKTFDFTEWTGSKGERHGKIRDKDYNFTQSSDDVFTYYARNSVKLDGKRVTPEQAAAEWESKKETCDIFHKSANNPTWWNVGSSPAFDTHNSAGSFGEYELRPKALKQVSWTGSREDVIALLKELGFIHEGDIV